MGRDLRQCRMRRVRKGVDDRGQSILGGRLLRIRHELSENAPIA